MQSKPTFTTLVLVVLGVALHFVFSPVAVRRRRKVFGEGSPTCPAFGGWIKRHPALFGAIVGAVVGAGLGQDRGKSDSFCSSKGGAALVSAGLFTAGGALVG